MRASISVGNLKNIDSKRPSSDGELTVMLGNSMDEIQFLIQVSKDKAVTFDISEKSARVLIASLDQLAASLERKYQSEKKK